MTFTPDRSVSSAKDDKLNRAPFAYRLADTIRDWKQDESIVIGLYGPWGSGKTSVLSFTVERLLKKTKNWKKKPIVIWFNPWNFSEKEQLLQAFFQQVYAEINKVDPAAGKDVMQSVKKFAQALGALQPVPVAGDWLSTGGKLVELFTTEKTLEDTKNEVSAIFKKLDRRILILIDDVDRLSKEEIRLLFQLIKMNADFPNTIYLVAFDRSVVESALTNEQGVSGRAYLEKIVQVGFNIPEVDPTLLEGLFFDEINLILQDVLTEEFDRDHWAKIYLGGLRPFLQTVRDVKRFINSLGVTLRMMKSEVDAIDFIGLEGLRVFMPEIYRAISENKALFTDPRNSLPGGDRLTPKIKEMLDTIFEKQEEQAETARKICVQLFPALESVYGNRYYGNESWLLWRKQKRICHKDNFDVYFLLGTPKGDVSHFETEEFLSQYSDANLMLQELNRYLLENRSRRLLERVSDRVDSLKEEQVDSLCKALTKFGDVAPDIKGEMFDIGMNWQIGILIRSLLIKMGAEKRFTWYKSLLEENPPLYTSIDQVHHDTKSKGENRKENLFTEEQLTQLIVLCVKNIEAASQKEDFMKQKEFSFIMMCWKLWDAESAVRKSFLEDVSSHDEKFLDFAGNYMRQTRSQTSGSYQIQVKQEFSAKSFFEFFEIETVKSFLGKITLEEIKAFSHERLLTLKALQDSVSGVKGEADDV